MKIEEIFKTFSISYLPSPCGKLRFSLCWFIMYGKVYEGVDGLGSGWTGQEEDWGGISFKK